MAGYISKGQPILITQGEARMVSKNNKKLIAEKNRRNEKQRFAIRKLNVGVASVLLGITFSIYGGGQVVAHADTGNASDQVAPSNTGDNSLANKSEVTLSSAASSASQSSTSATSANSAVQSQASANSQTAATANTPGSDSAVASSAAVETTKNQSTAENQPSTSQEVQTPAQAQPVAQENGSGDPSLNTTRQALNTIALRKLNSGSLANHMMLFAASDSVETTTLNLFTNANNLAESRGATRVLAAEAEDPNAVTVSDAKGFIDAIQNGTATTINVANNINLASEYDGNYKQRIIRHKRDILIQSATPGVKHIIDFSGNSFSMNTQNSVTFKDLDLYERSYWGIVYNAGGYVFDNVNFAGSQLIYTESSINSTLTFKNNVTATAVGSYTGPIDGESRSSQGGNTQQILQFVGGTNHIIFDENSNVTLGTTNSNVLEIDGGTATIDVKNGANVTINPHSKGNPENRNGIGTGSIARAIASNANTTINVDKGANLTINTEKASGDSNVAGALYLNSDAKFNINGNLNINSNGTPSTTNNGYPVYIAGNAAINVGNGGKFNLSATNTGSYSDNLMSISGKGTVKLAPHSNFRISADGTGALTAINLSSGSTFTSDQPDSFTIDLSANTSTDKSLIKNGTINFTRVRTVTDGNESQPLGKINVTYDRNGNVTSYIITAQDENTVKQVGEGLNNKNLIDLVKAGEDVTLSNLHLSKNNVLTGTVASSGSNNPIYVTVTVGGVSTNVPVVGNYTVYTNTNGTVTSNNVDYAAQTASTGGNFSIDLSKLASSLTDDAQVKVTATKDFVEATQTESVAALRALNTTTLQELVDAAPAEEAKPSYYNATAEAQKAYTDAISTGKTILANPNNYDQVDVDNAVTAIQNAQKALTGEPTNKTELQAAVDDASKVESSDNYTNADADLQKAYTDAISAGQKVLSNDNATQTEVDNALTTINNAKDALNGDAKKVAKQAVADAATAKNNAIDASNLTDEEKGALKQKVTEAQTAADQAIDNATTNAAVTEAQTDGIKAIDGIEVPTTSANKEKAVTDLNTAAENAKKAIDQDSNLTDEEKQAAKDQIDSDAKTAQDAINNAKTNDDVKKAVDAGTLAIDKDAANAAIDNAVAGKKAEISNLPLTDEEKTALNNEVDQKAKDAKEAINTAATPEDVTTAQENGIKNINDIDVPTESAAKQAAKEAVAKAADDKNAAIDASNLTDEEKATLKQEVADAQNAANTAIDNATTNAAVTEAEDKGVKAINGIDVPAKSDAKEQATTDLNNEVENAKKAIDQDNNLTNEEKQAAKDQIDSDAKTAQDAINNAKTNDDVKKAVDAGTLAIDKDVANAAIDNAVAGKKAEISNSSLTDEEKTALNNEVDQKAQEAKEAINNATTPEAVTSAQESGVKNITDTSVPAESAAKQAAKEAVAKAADDKNAAIDASNLTDEEKATLKQEVTEAQKAADQAIDNATTNAAVTEAQTDGIKAIDGIEVPTTSANKEKAVTDLNTAAENAKKAIDQDNNLTNEEKQAAKDQIDSDAKTAQDAINNAKTNDDVKKAVDAGTLAIDKDVANAAIDNAVAGKKAEISNSSLTDEEKTALNNEVDQKANVAKEAINNATTPETVTSAQENGIKNITDTSVPAESAAKQAAKEAVAKAADDKNAAIDASNLTDEEKATLKQEVADAQNAAKTAIDNATTNAAVTEAEDKGVKAINGIDVPAKSDAKEQATTDLNNEVENAKKAIDQDNNLTNEEKQAAKDQIDSDAKTAQDAINNAKTNDDVKKAVDAGTLAIDKDVANAAIDNAVAGKKAEISNSSLTDEEKTALNNEVDQKANVAKEAINNATTPETVTSAQENGIKNITDTSVPAESAAKQAAKEAVAKAADDKNAAIDASNLTDEEKATLKQEVADAQNAANTAIDNATTNAAVTEAEDKGVKAINGIDVPAKSDAKEQATTDLNNEVENAKKAIDQDNNLTNEEKQAAKDQIDSDAKTAQDAINNAKTNDDVKKAVDAGTLAIDKDVANAAIDNAAAGKLKEIQDPLTNEEKQAYTDLINSEAKNAKQNIANATTVEEVTTAQNSGVDAINKIEVPTTSTVKGDAIKAIDKALQNKTDEINNASNLNTQEKTDLIKQATEAANTAKNNINNATTNAAVETAQINGEKAIADVTVPNLSDVKKESIDLINKALDAKTDEINNASNLSQDEKQSLINDATNAATEAINNVNQAQTNDDAKAAATTGVQNIENVKIPSLDDAKKNANQAIDDALNSKVNEINNASNLNDTEKQKLVDQATEAATTAKNNVENATTNDGVRDAANAGIDNIKGISFTSLEDAKNAANTAIDNALQAKTAEINNASNLSNEEKQDLINQASEAAKNAKDNINNATTNDAVTEAQNKGIADIANVTVPSLDQVKQDAINAIKQVQDAKNKQISAASNLSAEEQKELTDQVDKIANDAIAKINDVATTTNDAVTATRDDAIKQITDLFIPTLDGAQTDAINAIESAKNAKLNDINNATHLTDQEKQALVDQTNKVADEATEVINAAQTNDEVKSAETAGLDSINNITIPTLVQKQQEAIEELNAARDAKNSAIDNAADLTTDEKNALKDKVQAEYSNAVSNITSATTDEAVTTAKEDGIAAIKDIQIPTKSAAKEQATTDLNNAVDDAKKAIDQDSNLTDAEKQAAKDQIDSDAKKAQEAIDNAKTDDEVNSAVDNGQLAIDKGIANAAIDNAVAGKKDEIAKSPLTDEEKTALNNEVDQKAQDAKEAINNATTPEAVTTAQDNGVKNINDTEVPTESTAKEAAKKAIAETAEAKNNAIDSSNLTDEEKTALKQEVTDAQNAANTAIDNATTNAAVTEAEDNGIKAINGIEIPTKSPAKDQATTDLNDAVDDAKKAIDQDSNLTDAEKQAAKDQIDSDAKKAQEAIDNAKTDDEVKTAVDNGQLAIDKDVANAAIDNAVAGKKAEIAKAPLTTDEAKALNDLVDQEAKAAKKAIDSATTIPAVEDAKNTGVAAINDIAVPTTSSTKDQANQTIDDALANKIKEINDATNLSDKQKQDLIDQANEEAAKAKENIKNATSNEAVNKATTDGVDAIANVTVPSLDDAKDQAKNLIDDVLNEKKNEINNADNLSDSQKQDLINQATDEADQAKKNIDNATTNNDVQTAEDNGAQAIENVTVPSLDEAKKASTKVIDEVLKEKTAEINAATNLSNDEKDALIKDATTAANTAKDNIAKATTNDAVKDAETDGVKAILDIKVPGREDQQKDAIAALDRALADKVSEINNANNLSETTKQDLKQQAQAAYTTAVDNVNNAQTSAEINTARDNGVQAILDITVPTLTDAQNASITAVEQVRDAKKTQIEAAKNLTEAQKEALKNQVDEIADKAIDNIKNATTDATVKDAETAGINEILNVTIPTLDAAKSDAKQAIADALTAKTAEINAAQNLTDAEKQKLIDQAQTEAAAANKNIDAATTNDAAELAAKNGVQAILDIQVPTVEETRDQAKKNVDNALNSKKEEINNSNLSPAAKEALINEAEQAAENARTAIDNATTASAISEAEAAGIAAIENIKVSNAPTESDNSSNHQTNTETPTEGNSTSQDNNNATQAPVQGNNTQADLTGSHGTNLTTGQQTEKAADTNSKETLPQTGNETERGLSIAGLAIASLLGLFGLSGLGKKKRD